MPPSPKGQTTGELQQQWCGYFDAANLDGAKPDGAISTMMIGRERHSANSLLQNCKAGVRLITGLAASHVEPLQAFSVPHHTRSNFPAVKILENGKNAPAPVGPDYSRQGLL